jgi:uncharacterized membrane protein
MNKRSYIHAHANTGERIADAVTNTMGSWRFIIGQAVLLTFWFALNSVGWFFHWDSYPFILCNLFMSAEAAFASPLILMSQNRQASKDRKRDDLEAKEVDDLYSINTTQLDILKQQSEILELLHASQPKQEVKRHV